jgi:hypothetical protein
MADRYQEQTIVNANEKWEIAYWREQLGCTEEELLQAIKSVGPSIASVRAQLREMVSKQGNIASADVEDEYAIEQEGDAGELLAGKSYDAVVTATDWTVETLMSQLNKGNIGLSPSFQRRDAWTQARKSEFIESLFMGLPVPQLVLAANKISKGAYIVLDGKQRLLTLRQFSAHPNDREFPQLRLSGLRLRPELNGLTLQDIGSRPDLGESLAFFENYTIRTIVLRNWPSDAYLYLVFLRLNSGSLPLSTQELRQVVSPGPFTSFASEFTSQSAPVMSIFSTKMQPDFRMRDVELTIRFYGLRYELTKYAGNLKGFLDETCRSLNEKWDSEEGELRAASEQLEKAIKFTWEIFGLHAFRKWNGNFFERRFNRAIFDIMVFYFADPDVRKAAAESKDEIVSSFMELCSDDLQFRSSLETTTKSISAMGTRLGTWGLNLAGITGLALPVPRIDDNSGRISV